MHAFLGSFTGNILQGGLASGLTREKMNASGLFRSSLSLDPTLQDLGLNPPKTNLDGGGGGHQSLLTHPPIAPPEYPSVLRQTVTVAPRLSQSWWKAAGSKPCRVARNWSRHDM